MKKILVVLLSVCLASVAFTGLVGCRPRNEILKIYNWGDYMPKSVRKGFAAWYKEKTGGKDIVIQYEEFETNEDIYTAISKKKSDYDLVCPSDYMLERMARGGLLKELSSETLGIVTEAANPDLMELFEVQINESKSTLNYAMPYIWGTLGIMYNAKWANAKGVTAEDMASWSVLFDSPYGRVSGDGKVWMKNSQRDVYTAAMLYKKADLLLSHDYNSTEYRNILSSIFSTAGQTDTEIKANIATAKDTLIAQKKTQKYVKGYEIESGKEAMLADKNGSTGEYGMFWSCDAGFVMNGYEEDCNQNLRYVVPEEGSNVWVDCFAIPKYAKNVSAANLFIQYLCEVDVAYACMDYAAAPSGIAEAAEAYKADLEAEWEAGEPGGFFRDFNDTEFYNMFMEMMFPSTEMLKRCAVMRDFGKYNENLDNMWESVEIA